MAAAASRPPARKTAARTAAKAPAKRAPARKVVAPKAIVDLDDTPGPINLDADTGTDEPVETVHLFTLNGIDYHVPREPDATVALKFLRMRRTDPTAAQGWMLEQIVGEEGYTALMEWPGLRTRHLVQILAAVEKLAVDAAGAIAGPLGRG